MAPRSSISRTAIGGAGASAAAVCFAATRAAARRAVHSAPILDDFFHFTPKTFLGDPFLVRESFADAPSLHELENKERW